MENENPCRRNAIPSLRASSGSRNILAMRVFPLIVSLLILPGLGVSFDPAQQDDSLALVRHFIEVESPLEMPEKEGLVSDRTGLTVSLMGGADVFRLQEFGFFEALLHTSFPDQKLRVRNLGWSGDTVYRQQRPMFFYTETGDTRDGSVPDGREKIEPGVLVLSFGKMESLDGLKRLEEFGQAYERLIGELQRFSKRIVVVEPVPFAKAGPAGGLADERNAVLDLYTRKIKAVAERKGVRVARMSSMPDNAFERTGIHLSGSGLAAWSMSVVQAFGAVDTNGALAGGLTRSEILFDSGLGPLIERIVRKNHIWNQYYRPTNWAFLYGDRQHVPSSRDHENNDRRWFVEELNQMPSLILESESEIWSLVKGGER